MARKSSDGEFVFSSEAVSKLRDALGESAAPVISQLQALLNRRPNTRPVRVSHDDRKEVGKIVRTLRAAIQKIDDTPSHAKEWLLRSRALRDFGRSGNAWQRLTVIQQNATDSIRELEALGQKRGRPIDTDHHELLLKVALVLRRNGIRVAASRTGTFAKVLDTILSERHGRAPKDLFLLVKEGSHFVKGLTSEELRRLVKV